jgi:hypothetical protein
MISVMLLTRHKISVATMYQNGKEQRKVNKGITNIIIIQAFEAFQNSSLRVNFRNIINVCIATQFSGW